MMAGLVIGQATGRRGVTSVALTVPSILSVAGSPITDSGTLAVTLANQNANLIFAGPSSGGAAAPTFRSLAEADIPTLTTQLGTAVILAPGSSARNVIQPGASTYIPLIIKGAASQSADLFQCQDSNGNVLMSINKDGKVGIGMTPGFHLTVNGTVSAQGLLRAGSANGGIQLDPRGGSGVAFQWYNPTGVDMRLFAGTDVYIITSAGGVTQSYSDANTNTVANLLALNRGSSGTPTTGFGTGVILQGHSSTNQIRAMGRVRTEWTTATDASRASKMVLSTFNSGSENDAVTILADGKVGIGIVPSANLQVHVGTNQNFVFQSSASETAIAAFNDAASGHVALRFIAAGHRFFNAGSAIELLTLQNAGKVGINQPSPSSQLDVGGDVEIGSANAFYMGGPTTDGSWRITRSGNDLVIQRRESGSWVTKSTIAA